MTQDEIREKREELESATRGVRALVTRLEQEYELLQSQCRHSNGPDAQRLFPHCVDCGARL